VIHDPMRRPRARNPEETAGILGGRIQSTEETGAPPPDLSTMDSAYSGKHEIRGVLQALPRKLNRGLAAIESELSRLKHNHAVVRGHEEDINSEEVIPHYVQAETELAQKYDQYLSLREDLFQQVLAMDQTAQSVLDELGVEDDTGKPPSTSVAPVSPTPTSPSPRPAARTSSPKKTAEPKRPPKKKDDLSDRAMAQHAAAMFGLSPETMKKIKRKSKETRG
jgi:hypothetical protein